MNRALKNSIYDLVDIVTLRRGLPVSVNGETLRLAPHWSRYYPTDYEPHTFRFLREHCHPGGTVIDLGAHIGLFSVVAARLVAPGGKVFAFEPTTSTRKVLQQTIKRNALTNLVEVRSEAVGETSGTATFFDSGDEISIVNSLVQTERNWVGSTVNVVSLDNFVFERSLRVNFLKIDVEGAELGVLRGAVNTFKMRPFVALSLHPKGIATAGDSLGQIWDILDAYRMAVTENGVALSQREFCGRADLFDVQLSPR